MKQAETPQETAVKEQEQEAQQESTRQGSLVYGGGFSGAAGEEGTNNLNPYMPGWVQQKMERAFGHDFSNVNIYANSPQANNEGVEAFTYGNDIHFANGNYNPYTEEGHSLLEHELTHVVQQRQGRAAGNTKSLEEEADNLSRNHARITADAGKEISHKTKHYKIYRISKEEIDEIRTSLNEGKGLEAYNKLTKKIKSDFALANFLADYPDIAKQLLEKLDPEKQHKAYARVAGLYTLPVKALDADGERALAEFKEKKHLSELSSLASENDLDLNELLTTAGISLSDAAYNPDDLLLKLEQRLPKSTLEDERYARFLSDLILYNLVSKIEMQAGLKEDIPVAKDREYYSKIKPVETAYGYRGARLAAAAENKKNIRSVAGRKARKEVRDEYKKRVNLPDKLALGMRFLGNQKPFVLKGLKLSEIEEMVHWKGGLYGVSFDPNAIIDELIIDKKNLKTTLSAKSLILDKFNMTDAKGGFIADQLVLSDVKIELDYRDEKDDQIHEVGKKETSHPKVDFSANIDLHGLRLVDGKATTGVGRLKLSNFQLTFDQDISSRDRMFLKVKSNASFQLDTLIDMLYKGPMLLNPAINGIVKEFTAGNSDALAAHTNSYKDAFKGMLAEDLGLVINYDKIQLDHLIMTDTSYTGKQGLPYIEQLVIGGAEANNEIELNTHKITQQEIDEALRSKSLNQLPADVAAIVRNTATAGAYTKLKIKSQSLHDSTKAADKAVVEASYYFELFRRADFKMLSPNGSISGASLLTEKINQNLPAVLKEYGMELPEIDGIGDFSYSNLRIDSAQNASGLINGERANNEISLDLKIPQLKARSMNYKRDGIVFSAQSPYLNELTVGIKITFNPGNTEEPYTFGLGKVNIRYAELKQTAFTYGDNVLDFSSTIVMADNLWFEMGPASEPDKMGFGFERLQLYDAVANVGGGTIQSEPDKPIVLTGLDMHSDKTAMELNLQNMSIFGKYSDQNESSIPFEKENNVPDPDGRKLIHYRKSVSGHEHYQLFLNTPIVIPQLIFADGDQNKLNLTNVLVNGVFIDVEKQDDVVLINLVHIDELSTRDYTVTYGNNALSAKKQPVPADDKTKVVALRNVELGNLAIDAKNFGPGPSWDFGWKSMQETPSAPSTGQIYTTTKNQVSQATDNAPFVTDRLLSEKKTMVFHRKSDEQNAYIGWNEFHLDKSTFSQKDGKFKELVSDVLSLKQFSAKSVNGESFQVADIMKLFAQRELGELAHSGTITDEKDRFLTGWKLQPLKEGSKLESFYNLETNYTSFDNLPLLDLRLDTINMSFGDFHLASKSRKGSPAEVSNIALDGVRINHTTGEVEIDTIAIGAVTANGLFVDTMQSGWKIDLGIDQRASVHGIVLKGWKTKLDDPSYYAPQGKKATLDIAGVVIPKLVSDLSGGEKEKGHGETSGSIGKISYVYNRSGAQSLTIKDLFFANSRFTLTNDDSEIDQFLKSVSSKKIVVEQDAKGRKSIKLIDPVIKGYKFINTEKKDDLTATADLICTGEIDIYEGNYDDFVANMSKSLSKPMAEREAGRFNNGTTDAWIIDASRCKIEMTNLSYEQETVKLDTRSSDQLLLDELLYFRSKDKNKPFTRNTSLAERGITEHNAPEILENLKESLKDSAENKIAAHEKWVKENQRMIEMLRALDGIDGEIYATVNNIMAEFQVRDGKIDMDQVKVALSELTSSLIDNINPDDLIRDARLTGMARSIQSYLDSGVMGDALAAGYAFGLLLGTAAALMGPWSGGLAFIAGCFIGIILGGILAGIVRIAFRDVLGMARELCSAIIEGRDYRAPLRRILNWAIMHLDVFIENDKPFLGFTFDGYREQNDNASIAQSVRLLQLGNQYDDHVDEKTNEIGVGGFLRYFMRNPGRADNSEFTLSEKISKYEKDHVPTFEILDRLYSGRPDPATDLAINGLGGLIDGRGFTNGSISPELQTDLSRQGMNMIRQMSITTTLGHVNLRTLQDVFNFDNEKHLRFLNSEKTNLYTYSSLNADNALQNGDAALRLATGPVSGFTLSNNDKSAAIGFGDISVPVFSLEKTSNENDSRIQTTNVNAKSPFVLEGFQAAMAKNKMSQEKGGLPDQPKKEQLLGVKNPLKYPTYELKGDGYETAVLEFSILTGTELTHIMVVDGDFLSYGDPWYLEIMDKTGLRKNCRIGFVRECDTWDNKLENYIGTLEVDHYGTRNYKPFTGKQ